jgi:hypothetical protein
LPQRYAGLPARRTKGPRHEGSWNTMNHAYSDPPGPELYRALRGR